jgi:hypothetical protein
MIRPTVGRVVWFWGPSTSVQPRAAIIAFVHSDTCVNLAVFDRNGESGGMESVVLWQGDGERPDGPHAEWMPYQKGQAAKTEQLERVISEVAKTPVDFS